MADYVYTGPDGHPDGCGVHDHIEQRGGSTPPTRGRLSRRRFRRSRTNHA